MNIKYIHILSGSLLLAISSCASSAVFYEDNFENGVKYAGESSKHPGGGFISYIGGETSKLDRPGDGKQDGRYFTNVIVDKSPEAMGASKDSTSSLKTQYRGSGSGQGWGYAGDFGLNTTIINFPETPNVYIRWYQKWGKNWIWPRDQQKLAKVRGPEQSQNFKISFGANFLNLTKKSPPPNDYFNETYVYANLGAIGEVPSTWRQDDNDPTTNNFPLEKDRWYCIEIMVKSNTPGKNDAELGYWIDDVSRLYLKNTNNRGNSTRGIDTIEMQHVLQDVWDGARGDTPTWMDNIVIANEKVGCLDRLNPVAPKSTITIY